jgi:hypothetical protein
MTDGFIGETGVAVPDLMDWVVGVRGFTRRGHQLMSPYQETVWNHPAITAVCRPSRRTARAPLVALGQKPGKASNTAASIVARQQRLGPHAAPHVDCFCGTYAFYADDDHLAMWPITGVIRARGRIIVHPDGFRAQYVEVVALAFDPNLGDEIEHQRLREVTRRACAWWRIPLLRRDQLLASLPEFGSSIPMDLRPEEN